MIVFHSSLNDAGAKILMTIGNVCLELREREKEKTHVWDDDDESSFDEVSLFAF